MSKLAFAIALFLLVAGCSKQPVGTMEPLPDANFVGSRQCASCHQDEYQLWRGSNHELAMQVASEDTVLGDFSDVEFEYFDSKTSFFRRNGAFLVRTENANGEQQEFEISHTFGIEPLQQYLTDFPDGRKQALPFTWDARPEKSGGQRWYHLYSDDYIRPNDPLHWTGPYFTWNTACAECHSTNLEIGYEIDSDSFDTTFDEISVGCEACHGPGSMHLKQAGIQQFDARFGLLVDLDDRRDSVWIMNGSTGIAERSKPNLHKQQPESCGRCHSRRSILTESYEYGKPLADTHLVSLLEENLYHADGRILDEVYVYGSLIQSKMYNAGVTCTDCHDPHSGRLRAGPIPNDTCAQCHLPARFATAEHSSVDTGNCVDCHMPATTYMGIDDRRDHSFRIPGAGENANHYGSAIAAGRTGYANEKIVNAVTNPDTPGIARATLLSLIAAPADHSALDAIVNGFSDSDPLVRIGALRALGSIPVTLRGTAGSYLLRDPVRGVRIEAAHAFLDQRDLLPLDDVRAYPGVLDEYRDSLLTNVSNPNSAVRLAELESYLGNSTAAKRFYEHALRLEPDFAAAHHAFGLFLVRERNHESALAHIRTAAESDPENWRYVYVHGVAENSVGNSEEALRILDDAWLKFPNEPEIGFALATMLRDRGERERAILVVEELRTRLPDNATVDKLFKSISNMN